MLISMFCIPGYSDRNFLLLQVSLAPLVELEIQAQLVLQDAPAALEQQEQLVNQEGMETLV